MARSFQRSPLALAILALLYETPMHPYRMQQLIRQRGKDKVVNVQRRASLYQTIGQLQRAGLITVQETARDENRPERTIYAVTDAGIKTTETWMREMLSTPGEEFPEFPAAVSFLPLLTPEDARQQLEHRAAALRDRIAQIDEEIRSAGAFPRLFLLEYELLRTTTEAELKWVDAVIEDLRTGQLTWGIEWMQNFLSGGKDTGSAE
jgi:DNA-binding PadR family transcriptional regulator